LKKYIKPENLIVSGKGDRTSFGLFFSTTEQGLDLHTMIFLVE